MSDVDDFTQVQAGAARVVYSNNAYVPGTTGPVDLALLQTERSLVVLMSLAFANDRLSVVGNTSGAAYSPSGANDGPGVLGWTCPAYGVADPTVRFRIAGNVQVRVVTVIAVPDEILFGESWAPESVIPVSAGTFNPVGTPTNPTYVEAVENIPAAHSVAEVSVLNNQTVALLAPPAGGNAYHVKMLSFTPTFVGAVAAGSFADIAFHTNLNAKLLQKISVAAGVDLSASQTYDFWTTDGIDFSANVGAGLSITATAVYKLVTLA